MLKLVLFCAIAAFLAETTAQQFLLPVFRHPPHKPVIIRKMRSAANDEPQWLYQGDNVIRAPSTGDHPYIPPYVDDVKLNPNQRYARSLDSPSAKRGGGSHQSSGSTRNTGATHPGHNRRNTRSIRLPTLDNPIHPFPRPPKPFFPDRRPLGPIYARHTRDLHFPGMKKPSHRDVIIPNWNPNARTNPWNVVVGKRTRRSLEELNLEEEYLGDENFAEIY